MGLIFHELIDSASQMVSGYSLKGGNSTMRFVVQDDGTSWPLWTSSTDYANSPGYGVRYDPFSDGGTKWIRDNTWQAIGDIPGTRGWTAVPTVEGGWVNPQDMANLPTTVLGNVILQGNPSGSINRVTPYVHPSNPYWNASAVTNATGTGKFLKIPALYIPGQPDTPKGLTYGVRQVPYWAFYQNYLVQIEFQASTFALLPNTAVTVVDGTNNGISGWAYFNGTRYPYKISREWTRYTNFEMTPKNDNMTMPLVKGQMTFADTSPAPVPPQPSVNGSPFSSSIRMLIPDTEVKFFWHMVPFRYYTSRFSYLRRFVGLINQVAFNPQGYLGNVTATWQPGQALYKGCRTTTYTPPVPQASPIVPGVPDVEKLCDLELDFVLTNRFCETTPSNSFGILYTDPQNSNWIASGHNLLPSHIDRKFHYATVNDKNGTVPPAKRYPCWFSFPFELLFTDPDFVQPIGPGNPTTTINNVPYPSWQASTAVSPT